MILKFKEVVYLKPEDVLKDDFNTPKHSNKFHILYKKHWWNLKYRLSTEDDGVTPRVYTFDEVASFYRSSTNDLETSNRILAELESK